MNHTPGPWELRGLWIYPAENCDEVGRVSEDYLRPSKELKANGRLMARAPEMLAVLQEAVQYEGVIYMAHYVEDGHYPKCAGPEPAWLTKARAILRAIEKD